MGLAYSSRAFVHFSSCRKTWCWRSSLWRLKRGIRSIRNGVPDSFEPQWECWELNLCSLEEQTLYHIFFSQLIVDICILLVVIITSKIQFLTNMPQYSNCLKYYVHASVYACGCVPVHVCVHQHVCVHEQLCACVCMCMYMFMCVCAWVCMHVSVCTWVFMCMCTWVFMCMCTCIYVHALHE